MNVEVKAAVKTRRSRKKRIFFTFGLFLFLLAVAALLAEVAIRLFCPLPLSDTRDAEGRDMYQYRDGLRILRSNYRGICTAPEFTTKVESNDQGFRAGPFQKKKAPGAYRIFALGDSFTFGLGVEAEEAYPLLLGKALSGATGRKVEVLNFGIPGYGTLEELEVLRRFSEYDPDLVMVGVLVEERVSNGNDLIDNVKTQEKEESKEKNKNPPKVSRSFPAKVRKLLRKNSHLYRLFELRFGLPLRRLTSGMQMGDPRVLEKGWALTFDALEEMKLSAAGAGASLLVVYIPFFSDIHKGNTAVSGKIKAFCREKEIACCDLLPLHLRHRDADIFYPLDLHWNQAGHRLVAEELKTFILKAGLD